MALGADRARVVRMVLWQGARLTAIGGGMAPLLSSEGLEPFDLTHPDVHDHQFGYQARIGFLPDELGESSYGLLFAHNELNWEGEPPPAFANVTHFDQTVIGLFGDYVKEPWRVSTAWYYVDMEPVNEVTPSHYDSFVTGYLQVERSFPHGMVLFGRREDSINAGDSTYLTLFPNFVETRTLMGLRWDYHRRQALTVQVANSRSLSDSSYFEYRLQWSGALF